MRRSVSVVTSILTALALGFAAEARAEVITITSGSVTYARNNPVLIILPTLGLRTDFGTDLGENPDHACFDCEVGSELNLSTARAFGGLPSITFGGRTFNLNSGQWQFLGGSVRVPQPPPSTGKSFVTVAAPFTFTSEFNATTENGAPTQLHLRGRGTATATFGDEGSGAVDWFVTRFDFSDAAAVPEPSTMALLLLTGAGAVVRRSRTLVTRCANSSAAATPPRFRRHQAAAASSAPAPVTLPENRIAPR